MYFSPTWPETTIFWGAGATAQLNSPTTADQGGLLKTLGNAENWQKIEASLPKTWTKESIEHLRQLLSILGYGFGKRVRISEITYEQQQILQHRFPDWDNDKNIDFVVNLRNDYDLDALQAVIKRLPKKSEDNQFLMDLFNILDMHIVSGLSFNVESHQTEEHSEGKRLETLTITRLIGARNCLTMLITLMFNAAYRALATHSVNILKPYEDMTAELAALMQEEGIHLLREHTVNMREAYLFSYALVSLNFDPILLWLLFNAHKTANESTSLVTQECQQIKLFHDLAHFVGSRDIHTKKLVPWYPYNESAVQRVNDPDHLSGRIARVGKFYFMHGCMCWRECPSCGKLNMVLGDEWRVDSPTLYPPLPLQPQDNFCCEPRSKQEEEERAKGHIDAIQCVYCGAITYTRHTPLIMQTSYKGRHASFLEEIARDMRACLEQTKHVVLLGYSLPPDDVIYRALLPARLSKNVKCSVIVGYEGKDRWLEHFELEQYCNKHKNDSNPASWGVPTIQAACQIFGEDNVRAYTGGIPQVFRCEGSVKASLKKILYPLDFGIDCFTANGVERRKLD